jgi:nuclear transcription factor Y gamma
MLPETVNEVISAFWQSQMHKMINEEQNFKKFSLPLARIKKVMKSDEEVKSMMIAQDAPIIFAKACELFILELTLRSWLETEDNKRRTLQKSDIVTAVQKSDMFDFLIDIVPRDDKKMEQFGYYQPNQFVGLSEEQLLQLQNLTPFNFNPPETEGG